MNRRCAKSGGTARVAVIGAPTQEGTRLRKALAEFGVPGGRVDLYGSAAGEALLSEYDGEARMVQEADLQEISQHELIFICGEGPMATAAAAAAPESMVIDLIDCLPPDAAPRPVHMDINPEAAEAGPGRRYAVPHPLVLMLAELLHPLNRELGLAEATAVIIRPASDFGPEGVEELREQTVRLLSFSDVPVETFGRQLAFNVIPQGQLAGGQGDLDGRIRREVAALLGWKEHRFSVRWLTAPMFHGHAAQLHFRVERSAPLDRVREVLYEAGLIRAAEGDPPATPLDVAGQERCDLSDLSEDGLGGYWAWVVSGGTATRGARQAVRLAAQLGLL